MKKWIAAADIGKCLFAALDRQVIVSGIASHLQIARVFRASRSLHVKVTCIRTIRALHLEIT